MNPIRLVRNLLLLSLAGFTATAATLTWNNASGGAWNEAANWTPNQIPGPLDSVVIDLAGNYTIALNGTATVAGLAIGGAGSNPTLLVGGGIFGVSGAASLHSGATLNLSSGGLRGSWVIDEGAQLDLSSGSQKAFHDFNLLNRGRLRWLDGSVAYDPSSANSTFTNQGLWELHSDSTWSYHYSGARPTVRNEGILRKVGNTGVSTLNNFNFSNAGQIEVDQGQLNLQGVDGFLTGTAQVAQGAQLSFRSANLTNATPIAFTGPGRSTFESGNLWLAGTDQPVGLELTSGNLHLLPTFQGGVITNLTLEGIRLNGTHQIAGSLVLSNSSLAGNYTILPTGRLDFIGAAQKYLFNTTILNLGTLRWFGGSVLYDAAGANSTLTNQGLWEIHSDSSWLSPFSGPRPSIHNEGTLRKVGGTGVTTLNNVNFSNVGQIEVDQGELSLQSMGGLLTGTADVAQGSRLVFRSANLTNAAPVAFTGAGRSIFESGNLWLAGTDQPAGLELTNGNLHLLSSFQGGVITNLTLEGIRLNGTHQIAGSLVLSNSSLAGNYTILPTGRLDFIGAAQKYLFDTTVLNLGTLRWFGGSVLYDVAGANSTLTNRGLWEIHSDSSWLYPFVGPRPSIHNEGILRKVGGSGTSALRNFHFSNAGQIQVDQGQLHLQGIGGLLTGTANVAQGATVLFANASLTNTGPVSFTGPGRSTFESGDLWLGGADQPAGLQLDGGTLRLLPTFQGGTISNLSIQGITLVGTNRVQGLLSTSNSPINDVLIIEPGGQLDLAGSTIAPTANWHVLNLGTVRWLSGTISFNAGALGSRFTNANVFEIHVDNSWTYGFSGAVPTFRNEGVVRKLNGTGNTTFQNITFDNLGVIEAATGTLFLPATFTHTAGILRPTGGSIGSQNSFDVAGGTLEGSGTILRAQFVSGLISPGGDATGDLRFPNGLILNPAVTVRIHANGTTPGTQHDRLRVTGPVDLGGASL